GNERSGVMVIADRGDRAMSPEAVARRLRDLLLERLGSGVVAIWHYGAATFCPRMGEPRNARRSAVQDGFGSMGVRASSAGVPSPATSSRLQATSYCVLKRYGAGTERTRKGGRQARPQRGDRSRPAESCGAVFSSFLTREGRRSFAWPVRCSLRNRTNGSL